MLPPYDDDKIEMREVLKEEVLPLVEVQRKD